MHSRKQRGEVPLFLVLVFGRHSARSYGGVAGGGVDAAGWPPEGVLLFGRADVGGAVFGGAVGKDGDANGKA